MDKWIRNVISFWVWIGIILMSFMMVIISIVANAIPQFAVTIFAIVIFAASISVAVINPGIFAKQSTTATGG